MDTIRLRTLTKKSILKFGEYNDYNIDSLIKLNRTLYLRWVYYNCSMITFTDDILEEIHIYNDFRIKKPGTDKNMHKKCNEYLYKKIPGFAKFKQKAHNYWRMKKKNKSNELLRLRENKKSILQAYNQGKYK